MRRRHPVLIRCACLLAAALGLVACSPSTAPVSDAKVADSTGAPVGDADGSYIERTLPAPDGGKRRWLLRLPVGYEEGTPADVVFSFHGAGSNAESQLEYGDLRPQADRDGVILVVPDANKVYPDQEHGLAGYWGNAWEANLRERDWDIDFVRQLVSVVSSEYPTGDFYATGMSAGGDMVSALACLDDSPFAAYAPVTYMYYNEPECGDAPPRPFIYFHGSDDRVVPIEGSDAPWNDPPVREAMQRWADHNQCGAGPVENRVSDEVLHYSWTGCAASTEWYLIEGGGHTWPGARQRDRAGHTTDDISASDQIWELFFK